MNPGDVFTVIGSRGFVGTALVQHLRALGAEVREARHVDDPAYAEPLGHVVYCSGVAAHSAADADYAYDAHVEVPHRLLRAATFSTFLFLSSTRVYDGAPATTECTPLVISPTGADIFRITKIAGEALCLSDPRPAVRVARLSNVFGVNPRSSTFLVDVLRQAARGREILVRTSRTSAKDYISVADVCRFLRLISISGRERVYNVAHGENVMHDEIFAQLESLGKEIRVTDGAQASVSPPINVDRLRGEFGPIQEPLLPQIAPLYASYVQLAQD